MGVGLVGGSGGGSVRPVPVVIHMHLLDRVRARQVGVGLVDRQQRTLGHPRRAEEGSGALLEDRAAADLRADPRRVARHEHPFPPRVHLLPHGVGVQDRTQRVQRGDWQRVVKDHHAPLHEPAAKLLQLAGLQPAARRLRRADGGVRLQRPRRGRAQPRPALVGLAHQPSCMC